MIALAILQGLSESVRSVLRATQRNSSVAFNSIAIIALAIGATTTVFSVVNAVLLRPLAFPLPDQLVYVSRNVDLGPGLLSPAIKAVDLAAWREHTEVFAELGAYVLQSPMTIAQGNQELRLLGVGLTPSVFSVLRVPAYFGRTFDSTDNQPGADGVAVLSHKGWRTYFGSDIGVIGQVRTLNGRRTTIVGIMPESFHFPNADIDVWVPLIVENDPNLVPVTVGRIKPGVSLAAAAAEANVIYPQLARLSSATAQGYDAVPLPAAAGTGVGARLRLINIKDFLVGEFRPALTLLMMLVVAMMALACASVGMLLLAKTVGQRREIATKFALGASRGRLARQIVVEGVALGVAGGVVGTLLAVGAMRWIRTADLGYQVARIHEVSIDQTVLVFALSVSVLAGLLFGGTAAIRLDDSELMGRLAGAPKGGGETARESPYLMLSLVGIQVTMTVTLLVLAGFLVNNFMRVVNVDLGYNPDRMLTARVRLPEGRFSGPDVRDLVEHLLTRIQSISNVESTAVSAMLPTSLPTVGLMLSVPGSTDRTPVYIRPVTGDYFRTAGLRFVEGGPLRASNNERAIVMTETSQRDFFPNESILRKQIQLNGPLEGQWEITGVVEDVRRNGIETEVKPAAYVDVRFLSNESIAFVMGTMFVTARTTGDPLDIAPALRGMINETDPSLFIENIVPMSALLSDTVASPRLSAMLLLISGLVAVVLAVSGVSGVVRYAATRRIREIGIHVAVGAQPIHVARLVMSQSVGVTIVGTLIGGSCAMALSRVVQTSLAGLSPLGAWSLLVVCGMFVVVAGGAAYLPARRAAHLDPMVTLRE